MSPLVHKTCHQDCNLFVSSLQFEAFFPPKWLHVDYGSKPGMKPRF